MIVFRYDRTFEGLLTVVFDAYFRKSFPERLIGPGEPVPMFERAVELVRGADVLIVAGTSLAVYPAASLVRYVRPEVPVYLVDPGNPDTAWIRNPLTHIRERSAVGMPRLVRELREAEHARQAGK